MANLKKINLGAFAAGEIPYPVQHTYLDEDSQLIDISGWELLGFYVNGPDGDENPRSIAFETDGTDGQVRYVWTNNDMQTPGKYTGLLWVQDHPTIPAVRLASDMYVWEVKDGPGPTPS